MSSCSDPGARSGSSAVRRWLCAVGLALAGLLVAARAEALSVHAVYRSACSREVGIILRVEKRDIYLLRLDGALVKIPRHEIVSLLYYPLAQLPLASVPTPKDFPPLRVMTRQAGQVVPLVTGWPIDYSEHQISFLLRDGEELVIDRDSIWALSFEPDLDRTEPMPTGRAPEVVTFVHPQTSGFCNAPTTPTEPEPEPDAASAAPAPAPAPRQVFAQQILNDQIVIRRELDRLMEEYAQIVEYEGDQKFFPAPFLYKNRTMLGLWVSVASRYGASSTRSNNFTPLLVDELALGPFRYQHVFRSGASPNELFLHHEAQSQLYYRFKAAYFHTSVFFDPNLLLVGTKYGWRAEDLADERVDDRVNESLGIEFGFDWGPLSIELAPVVLGQAAIKADAFLGTTRDLNLWRVGLRLTFLDWHVQAFAGATVVDGTIDATIGQGDLAMDVPYEIDWQTAYARVNLGVRPLPALDLGLSGIVRVVDFDGIALDAASDDVTYASRSISLAVSASYALSHRFSVGLNVVLETQAREHDGVTLDRRWLPRGAVFTGFWF